MKKSLIAATFICAALLSSCGMLGTGTGTTSSSTSSTGSAASSILGSLVSGATSGSTGTSLLGSLLGAFTNTTNATTIVGTWTYQQPSIQFESSNLLAQAGGSVASSTIVNKIQPYYEKVGLKAGVAKITLNSNNTCAITLASRTINGTYTYDSSTGTITVKGSTGIKLFTAYASVSLSQLSLTLDTTNLLSLIQGLGSKTSNSTLSSISSISSSFNGMKTGFLFTK